MIFNCPSLSIIYKVIKETKAKSWMKILFHLSCWVNNSIYCFSQLHPKTKCWERTVAKEMLERVPFSRELSPENSEHSLCFRLELLHSISYVFFHYQSLSIVLYCFWHYFFYVLSMTSSVIYLSLEILTSIIRTG